MCRLSFLFGRVSFALRFSCVHRSEMSYYVNENTNNSSNKISSLLEFGEKSIPVLVCKFRILSKLSLDHKCLFQKSANY